MIYFTASGGVTIKSFVTPIALWSISAITVTKVTALKVFWSFLKVGAVLYGSGYVLFAYLDAELVSNGLLTREALIDAVAIGQFTPGPVLSTATFIGYQMAGVGGAIAATAGIFLPSFLFVFILNPLVPKMRKSKSLRFFLDSVNIAAVAVMLGVLVEMGMDTLVGWRSLVILAIGLWATFGTKKVNVMWLVIGSALLGYLLNLI